MQKVTVDWLKSIETLKDVPADQLQWMIDNSRHYTMAAGEHLFNVGETAIGTHIVVEGKIKIYTLQNQEIREMGIVSPREYQRHPTLLPGMEGIGQCENPGGCGADDPAEGEIPGDDQ